MFPIIIPMSGGGDPIHRCRKCGEPIHRSDKVIDRLMDGPFIVSMPIIFVIVLVCALMIACGFSIGLDWLEGKPLLVAIANRFHMIMGLKFR